MTLQINTLPAQRHLEETRLHIPSEMYKGCGKVWAAIAGGRVVGVRYMSDFRLTGQEIPAWVDEYVKLSGRSINCPWDYFGSPGRTKRARTADAVRNRPDCPTRPSGKPLPRTELERRAYCIVEAAQRDGFTKYRENCRNELSKLGQVVSGEASCTDFYPKDALACAALLNLKG